MSYKANDKRYNDMEYRKCGSSGLKLPLISLGLWHNFGGKTINPESKKVLFKAFDLGITHFDLANNYGPPYGSAEANFGKVMKNDLNKYRDELIISSKAGYDMWSGPYGEWGSKKHVIASCDQSLKRMGLEYVDIFYSHRFDPNTPLEETADALESIYRSGKAQYIGISSYSAKQTKKMFEILISRNIKILIHQPSYSLINRWIEKDLTKTLLNKGIGCIAFSPLAQGMLSEKYLKGIPKISRANQKITSLDKKLITNKNIKMIKELNIIAKKRGQSLSQMAIAWALNNKSVTSALIGVRNVKQLRENVDSLNKLNFTKNELSLINKKAKDGGINLWLASSSH
ncbi:MAG: L-glyceraldehyde 3-phosphate reductase [Alphaproteobacteria bacterium]|jgi:L-glyceraldehyde 3-phosphate reductase|nr:L-glyceraldehyde 3-phosphate reductase [Alphaproteobacteria bacterium]|tara:strand:- start:126 stop:1154 length:1029 start_codon:yes stop_codon:yes gene_type:complete